MPRRRRVGPRGLPWRCHMALRATSHPRGSRVKNKTHFAFLNHFYHLKIVKLIRKIRKNP